MNKILVLGSGYMARPVVSYLSKCRAFDITVASNQLSQAEEIASLYSGTKPVEVSIDNEPDLSKLVRSNDLVISMLPFQIHLPVAKSCLKHKVHMLTSSYVSPEMKELHQPAVDAGIMMVNEVGFDPGLDHMLSVQCFDEVRAKGGKITSYTSWCTGLPVPEAANVPLKYKFSWSPPTILLNALNPAMCLQEGKTISIPEGELMNHSQALDLSNVIQEEEFEGIINRNSTKYIELYNIPEVHSILRGSIRYKGFSATMRSLLSIGLITAEQHPKLQPGSPPITWRELLADLMQTKVDSLKDAIFKKIGKDSHSLKDIEEMGLLSNERVPLMGNPAHSLTEHLMRILSYKPGEQDMVIIHNIIDIEWPDNLKERRTITLTDYGDPKGFTAMARGVGFPAAIAAKLVLEGKIKRKGIVLPLTKDVYEPILQELKSHINPAIIKSTPL